MLRFSKSIQLARPLLRLANTLPKPALLQQKTSIPLSFYSKRYLSSSPLNPKQFTAYAAPPHPEKDSGETQLTTCDNGLRIVSENKPGHFSAIGVYIDAGSRYETPYTFGYSHLLDRFSFKSTQDFNAEQVKEKIDELGGNISCFSSRECVMYQAAIFPEAIDDAMKLLGQTILRPKMPTSEIEEVISNVAWELDDIKAKPEIYLPEVFHQVAYKDNTIGNPLLCPDTQLSFVTPARLQKYHKFSHSPEKIVIAAIGVPHQKLVDLSHEAGFTGLRKLESSQVIISSTGPDNSVAQPTPTATNKGIFAYFTESDTDILLDYSKKPNYTGGIKFIQDDNAEFTSILLGFESVGVMDENKIYPFAALQMLLGGGGSFSAGGPGKGMYTRLYTNVLNQYGFVESCLAFHHVYSDSGLFGISSSCKPGYEYNMLDIMINQLFNVASPTRSKIISKFINDKLSALEVSRAKNMLKSSMLMNSESRVVQLEDLGRQIQVMGKKVDSATVTDNIDKITAKDISAVATELLTKPVTLLVSGKSPDFMQIAPNLIANRGLTLPTHH